MISVALLASCASHDLAGRWQAQWPDGHSTELSIQQFGDKEWYLKGTPAELNGVYQLQDDQLACTKADMPRDAGFVWRVIDNQHLILIDEPSFDRLGDRWLGINLHKMKTP